MIGADLFHRFFLRFLVGLVAGVFLFVFLVHVFQFRIVNSELRADLSQQAQWSALHLRPGTAEVLTEAWGRIHHTIRMTIFDTAGEVVADSQPDRPKPDLAALLHEPPRRTAAAAAVPDGGWVVMSRPPIPPFPRGLHWELIAAALLVAGLVAAFLYPLVRSLSATLRQLTEGAEQVAAGHFGKTLGVERPDELGALVRAFDEMSGKLAEAEQLSTRLLHDVSHELRSPLGRIQAMAETIAHHPERTDEHLRGITEEVALLDRLVGDLLTMARTAPDAQAMRVERFSLRAWATVTLKRLESEARRRQIAWETRLPEGEHTVEGDPQRLAQAVGNLVDNAFAATAGRSGAQVTVTVRADHGAWSVTVADNGRGIPEGDLPHVFRRFYRVEAHRGRAPVEPDAGARGGVGLGLSLVRSITSAHGGEAKVASRPGEGTEVTLSFA